MNKEFIPYEQALALKELGFDDYTIYGYFYNKEFFNHFTGDSLKYEKSLPTPLYQQVFRWFREKYNYHHEIVLNKGRDLPYTYVVDTPKSYLRSPFHKTYEEAELECLKKLIEIVKK